MKPIKIMQIWNFFFKRKPKLCPICLKNPQDGEYGGKCFNCFYKETIKDNKNRKLKGGDK